jgi:nicotinate dehydrogenase subunit B
MIRRVYTPALNHLSDAGEPAIIPIAAAIANAVFDAMGVRFREVPLTPERVLSALKSRTAGTQRA